MDDVAHAAGVSRQGLYLHFPTKEELFRAAVHHALRRSQAGVAAALAADGVSLEARLERAFDEWVGQFVEAVGSDVDDLVSVCQALLGSAVDHEKAVFCQRIAAALSEAGLAKAYERVGLSADELATTLCATAGGLKEQHTTRAGFVAAMRVAITAMCLPLHRTR